MAVKLRLSRVGNKKHPFYRIVAVDSRKKQTGRHLEILGTYDPQNYSLPKDSPNKEKKGIINVKTDRALYWLKVGAQVTPTVKSIFKRLKISAKSAA